MRKGKNCQSVCPFSFDPKNCRRLGFVSVSSKRLPESDSPSSKPVQKRTMEET